MKKVTINTYEFKELSDEAKSRALQYYADCNVDYDWWSTEYDDAEYIGIKITSFELGRGQDITGEYITDADEVYAAIIEGHGENCSTYKTAKLFEKGKKDAIEKEPFRIEGDRTLDETLEVNEKFFLKAILKDYLTILENQCEYLQSEEAVIESIEANEYMFTIDGKPFYKPQEDK